MENFQKLSDCFSIILFDNKFSIDFRFGNKCKEKSKNVEQSTLLITFEKFQNNIDPILLHKYVLDIFTEIAQVN